VVLLLLRPSQLYYDYGYRQHLQVLFSRSE